MTWAGLTDRSHTLHLLLLLLLFNSFISVIHRLSFSIERGQDNVGDSEHIMEEEHLTKKKCNWEDFLGLEIHCIT